MRREIGESTSTGRHPVEARDSLGPREFATEYVNSRPIVVRGALAGLPAVSKWSMEYLGALAPGLPVRIKVGDVAQGRTATVPLGDYTRRLTGQAVGAAPADGELPYLHDLPLFSLIPALRADVTPFPTEFFPKFFRHSWWDFSQFFIGPAEARTPFHFDTLLTHNLFFQIAGRKRFVVVPGEDRRYCYTYNWRWSSVDPEQPDQERFPLFGNARVSECVLEPGDLLYMPPGMLHQVTSLTDSISFNVDWHDRRSALRGITAVRAGMPWKNVQYNTVFALGVWLGLSKRVLMPMLRSYYYYIS